MERLRRSRAAMRERIDQAALASPARLVVAAFAAVIAFATVLLHLPFASATGVRVPFIDALFTATSAVCVTGLTTVDTTSAWSPFGHVVILVCIKIGGLGVMTLASLLGLAVSRRVGLTQRMLTKDESRASGLGEVRGTLRAVVVISATVETTLAAAMFPRFLDHGYAPAKAAWHAIFFAVSSFNNAGFMSTEGGLAAYWGDPGVLIPVALGVTIGGLGYPVYLAILRGGRRARDWPLHAKLTLVTTAILAVGSAIATSVSEWSNPATVGSLGVGRKVLNLLFMSVNGRTGGFNTFDPLLQHEHTRLLQDGLMFIGAGSGGTAGGIRVTTVAVLFLAIIAEARGRRDLEAFGRRIGTEVVRVAISVTLFSLIIVLLGTGVILIQTAGLPGFTLDRVLYEAVSAFATCGLSSGVSSAAPPSAQVTLIILMFVGRVGSMTLAAALALNQHRRVIRYPSERPIIG